MDNQKRHYETHWHSFWFGFMSALAIVLFFLLIGTVTERLSFETITTKKIAIAKTQKQSDERENEKPQISLTHTIQDLEIDETEFNNCMQENRYADAVKNDVATGTEAGVKGTPHSFVLIDNAIYEIPGAYSEKGMREFFDDLLTGKDPRAKDISDTTTLASVDDDWIRGNDKARITVVEYVDIDCPFCTEFHKSTTNIMGDYSDDIRWVFRHMPSDGLHSDARTKAVATECVGELGGAEAFWQYVDTLLN